MLSRGRPPPPPGGNGRRRAGSCLKLAPFCFSFHSVSLAVASRLLTSQAPTAAARHLHGGTSASDRSGRSPSKWRSSQKGGSPKEAEWPIKDGQRTRNGRVSGNPALDKEPNSIESQATMSLGEIA